MYLPLHIQDLFHSAYTVLWDSFNAPQKVMLYLPRPYMQKSSEKTGFISGADKTTSPDLPSECRYRRLSATDVGNMLIKSLVLVLWRRRLRRRPWFSIEYTPPRLAGDKDLITHVMSVTLECRYRREVMGRCFCQGPFWWPPKKIVN